MTINSPWGKFPPFGIVGVVIFPPVKKGITVLICYLARHTTRFQTVWQLLLLFGIYNDFLGYWNNVEVIPLVAIISISLFDIE